MAEPPDLDGLLGWLANFKTVLPQETVHIEQWGKDVTLRGLTSRERDLFEEDQLRRNQKKSGAGKRRQQQVDETDLSNFRARLVARHIVENGMRTFANPRGEEVLGEQPAKVLDRLYGIAQKLSGFSAEDVEALAGNSEATAADGSSSSSPEPSAGPSLN